jgi:DNA modification methylase
MGMPWRVAFALQADGWWLRSDIIWSKPNPMPESVIDRPTKAHEYLFLLSKSARYFYDAEAIKETALWPDGPNAPDKISSPYGQGFTRASIGSKGNANTFRGGSYVNGEPGPRTVRGNAKPGKNETDHRGKAGFNARWDDAEAEGNAPASRNKRSVWTIATEPFPEAHFATFPTRLAEECIKAGCPVGGTVLDPFSGAGTTAMVADRRGRDAIGIELNPDYIAMAERRLARDRLERSQGTIADHDLVAEAAARRREAELAKLPPTPLEALMKGAVAPAGSGAPTRESEASAQ